MMEQARARVLISGRVQGVNFRASARQQAQAAGVAGWVRNLADGRVEALFEGSRAAVQHMVTWCQHGPPYAHVERADVEWEAPTGQEHGFRIA